MPRRARLTVLELGASPTAWASCHGLGADDWVVIAQQRDEAADAFTERVRQRTRRICKEDARLESVDIYTAPASDRLATRARRVVIEALGAEIAKGGRLTLWSDAEDEVTNEANFSAILATFGPAFATRQVAMTHQAWEPEERSGVRHAIPQVLTDDFEGYGEFDELG